MANGYAAERYAVQGSDTTGDAMKNKCPIQNITTTGKKIFILLKQICPVG